MSSIVNLRVPAEPGFARSVRMCASTLAVSCGMSVDDVEDIRMIAEEGFVYACATEPAQVQVDFALAPSSMTLNFSLGASEPSEESLDLVEMLLSAVCDEWGLNDAGDALVLTKTGGLA